MFESPILRFIARFYEPIIKIGSNFQSLFLFWMRLTWGHQFFLAGLHKLQDIQKTIQFFTSLNIPTPAFHAYFVGYAELICGFLLVIGFASRLAAIPLMFIMLTALGTAHMDIFTEYKFVLTPATLATVAPYPFLITCFLVLFFGPGRVSIDAWLKRWSERQPKY